MGVLSTVKGIFLKPKPETPPSEKTPARSAHDKYFEQTYAESHSKASSPPKKDVDRFAGVRKFIRRQKVGRKMSSAGRKVGVWSAKANKRLQQDSMAGGGVGFTPHDPFEKLGGSRFAPRDPFDVPTVKKKKTRKSGYVMVSRKSFTKKGWKDFKKNMRRK